MKHPETKRVKKVLVAKMLRLESVILVGQFCLNIKDRVDSCKKQFACDRRKDNAAREVSKTPGRELTKPKGL